MINKLQKHKLGFYELIDKPTKEYLQDYYANKYYQESLSSTYQLNYCLLYTSPSPRDRTRSRMPSSA